MNYSLDFLAWINRCMFPHDFADELKELGLNEIDWISMRTIPPKECNILRVWQNYCVGEWKNKDIAKAINKYLTKMYKQWEN